MQMSDRYFPRTALGGRIYLDSTKPAFCEEMVVDMLVARIGHRKARTEAELLTVVNESERGLPSIRTWIHEQLMESANRLIR